MPRPQRDEGAQVVEVLAEGETDLADYLAAERRGDRAPRLERLLGALNDGLILGGGIEPDAGDDLVGGGVEGVNRTAGALAGKARIVRDAELLQEFVSHGGQGSGSIAARRTREGF